MVAADEAGAGAALRATEQSLMEGRGIWTQS